MSPIERLEKRAANDPYSLTAQTIAGHVTLQVERCLRGDEYYFEYRLAGQRITRNEAAALAR